MFSKISTINLSNEVPVKSTVEISQNFVAFSNYINFSSMNNLLSYYGLIDAKMRASGKDLPLNKVHLSIQKS